MSKNAKLCRLVLKLPEGNITIELDKQSAVVTHTQRRGLDIDVVYRLGDTEGTIHFDVKPVGDGWTGRGTISRSCPADRFPHTVSDDLVCFEKIVGSRVE